MFGVLIQLKPSEFLLVLQTVFPQWLANSFNRTQKIICLWIQTMNIVESIQG